MSVALSTVPASQPALPAQFLIACPENPRRTTGVEPRRRLGIEGTTSVKSQKRFDGGCGEPTSSDQTVEVPWTTWSVVFSRDFEAVAGSDPSEQSGKLTTDSGETVTWKLTRTPMRR